MNFEEKKRYLRKYRRAMYEINTLEEELTKLRSSMLPSGIDYSKDKIQSSPSDPMPEYMNKALPLLNKLEDMQTKKIQEYEKVSDAIDTLTNEVYRTILRQRYLLDKNWDEISSLISYEKTRMFELHAEAISALDL